MPEIEYRDLSDTTDFANFVCGDSEIDKWLRNDARKHHGQRKHLVTFASFGDAPDSVVGFYALSAVVEKVANLGGDVPFFAFQDASRCPCLQLTYMAMQKEHQAQDHGTLLLANVIRTFARLGSEIGIPALIVAPGSERARKFYIDRGSFEPYAKGGGLFLPLRVATSIVTAASPEDEAQSI
ncbi:hypothetical protein [Sphingomonas sp. OK281]|uniref:hypothetical protein n=1 Tax=Sphingomonas sp. OK281 TaxID=1881067 RepID=UPI0008F08ACA|nr:hypothetical protein [Sphingomonas sp. OK281]SFO02014.1 hypothetical protein SAMN05428984_1660 [Sphingomonas sp. OK281]